MVSRNVFHVVSAMQSIVCLHMFFFRWSDLLQILRWFIVCSPLQFFSFFVWCSIFWVYEKRVSALHQKPYELWPHNSKRSSNHLKSDNGKNWKRRARKKDKAAFTRQTKVGKLVLANLSWCVSLNGIKQSANTFLFDANSLQTCLPPVFVPFTHTNFGLPSRVCQLKFAVWRPLKRVVGKKDDLLIFISSLWRKKKFDQGAIF